MAPDTEHFLVCKPCFHDWVCHGLRESHYRTLLRELEGRSSTTDVTTIQVLEALQHHLAEDLAWWQAQYPEEHPHG